MTETPSPGSVTPHVAPAFSTARALARAPIDAATWRAFADVALAPWIWIAGIVVITLTATGLGLIPALGIGFPLLVPVLALVRGLGGVERERLAATLGVTIERPGPIVRSRPWWHPRAWWEWFTDATAWRSVAYFAIALPQTVITWALTLGLAAVTLASLAFPLYGSGTHWNDTFGLWVIPLLSIPALWLTALTAQGSAWLHAALGDALLGRSAREDALATAATATRDAGQARRRAAELSETRAAAVAAADAERRRIERDLHDGAQQRLVALGVELGVARRAAGADPEVAVPALDHAHAEVKATLADLRDLVRGIHPAVLTDRGLDAALSALAANSPVRVSVDVPADLELDQAHEAAAYFVVAEALTNVAKHAEARAARIRVAVVDNRVRIEVTDDGRGGAHAHPGGGIAGLRGRVAALDGTLELTSPADAGTRLTVEIPCAS